MNPRNQKESRKQKKKITECINDGDIYLLTKDGFYLAGRRLLLPRAYPQRRERREDPGAGCGRPAGSGGVPQRKQKGL